VDVPNNDRIRFVTIEQSGLTSDGVNGFVTIQETGVYEITYGFSASAIDDSNIIGAKVVLRRQSSAILSTISTADSNLHSQNTTITLNAGDVIDFVNETGATITLDSAVSGGGSTVAFLTIVQIA
jgi:hypothetical protein